MASSPSAPPPTIGFLTVVEEPSAGLVGGYLLLNSAGRPLEFHCTTPVNANRPQQILYGAALLPYLYGEQIGQALIAKGRSAPRLICTDVSPALSVREFAAAPVVLIVGIDRKEKDRETEGFVAEVFSSARCREVGRAESWRAGLANIHDADATAADSALRAIAADFDLAEPFDRIREALREMQAGSRAA